MTEEILERLNNINKELEELENLERNEENKDMNNLEKIVNESLNMTEEQLDIFNSYVELAQQGADVLKLLASTPFGHDGFVEIARVIALGYVRRLYKDNDLSLTSNELQNLVLIHYGLNTQVEKESELDNILYALCATAVEANMKGGE